MANTFKQIVKTIKNWWLFLIAGIILIIGAVFVIRTPLESYVGLAWLFSILVLVNGISYTFFSVSNHKELEGWGWYLAGGIFEILLGFVLIYYPEISIITLPFVVGFWLLFRGVSIIASSLDLKDYGILDWGWLMLFGVFLTAIAFFMILNPLFGAFNVVYLTFLALLFLGVSHILLAFKLKKNKSKTLDVVSKLKKDFTKDFEILKEDVLKQIKDSTEETKKSVKAKLDSGLNSLLK